MALGCDLVVALAAAELVGPWAPGRCQLMVRSAGAQPCACLSPQPGLVLFYVPRETPPLGKFYVPRETPPVGKFYMPRKACLE